MNYSHHIIQNFPPEYPWWKKLLANIVFFVGGMIIYDRKNLLNNWDLLRATRKLKKGDVVLVGGLRRLTSFVIKGLVTHSLIYVGGRRFVHSVADGVEFASLQDIFCEYDTMIILRPTQRDRDTVNKIIDCAKDQVGKPYDYEFENDDKKFYCTELIRHAYKNAGLNDGITSKNITLPTEFINDKFRMIFLSHNLKCQNGTLELRDK